MIEDVRPTFLHDRPLLSIIAVGLFLLSLPFCCFAAVMVRYPDPADGTLVSLGPLSIQGQRIADPRCDQNHCWADYQIALMFQASSETHRLPLFELRVRNHINPSFGSIQMPSYRDSSKNNIFLSELGVSSLSIITTGGV